MYYFIVLLLLVHFCTLFESHSFSWFTAWFKDCSLLTSSTHVFLECFDIIFACANIWVVLINLVGNQFFLTKLSSSKVEWSYKHPNIDESEAECTSKSVKSFCHINTHRWWTCSQCWSDQELPNRNNFTYKFVESSFNLLIG